MVFLYILTFKNQSFAKFLSFLLSQFLWWEFYFERRKDYFSVENPGLGSKCLVFIGESLPIKNLSWCPCGLGEPVVAWSFLSFDSAMVRIKIVNLSCFYWRGLAYQKFVLTPLWPRGTRSSLIPSISSDGLVQKISIKVHRKKHK